MMEVENRLSERFDGLVDELPDELNDKKVQNGVIPEESDEEGDGMEGAVGEGEKLKSGGLHHPSGRIIKKVIIIISLVKLQSFWTDLLSSAEFPFI